VDLAEAAGDATPDGVQRLLNRATWDAGGVRDEMRAYVARRLGAADGVLVVDEPGFLKKGPTPPGCSGSTQARPGGWRTASWTCSVPT
jgi:SRSO17 transposase